MSAKVAVSQLKNATKKTSCPKSSLFDFSRFNRRHIALKIAYLGENYHGFAIQNMSENPPPTVEEELAKALVKCKLIPDFTSCNYSR